MKTFYREGDLEAGLDEVGRGSLVGRVYAAAVIWPQDDDIMEELGSRLAVKDSKKLSARQRDILEGFIKDNAIDYAIGFKDEKYIDKKNILNASIAAMHSALDELNIIPDTLLVDGNRFKAYIDRSGEYVSHHCLPGGDNKYVSIAAASILAKVERDRYIEELCGQHPELEEYGMPSNRGYGSAQHMDALKKIGPTEFHRMSYKCCVQPYIEF